MVKVTIEMDGEKVFEDEKEFVHFVMGTAEAEAYDTVGGLIGSPAPGALPSIIANSARKSVKELCGKDKKAYLILLAGTYREMDKILNQEIAESADAVGAIMVAAMDKFFKKEKGQEKS